METQTTETAKKLQKGDVFCVGCGAKASIHADENINGRDDLFSCARCETGWKQLEINTFEIAGLTYEEMIAVLQKEEEK